MHAPTTKCWQMNCTSWPIIDTCTMRHRVMVCPQGEKQTRSNERKVDQTIRSSYHGYQLDRPACVAKC